MLKVLGVGQIERLVLRGQWEHKSMFHQTTSLCCAPAVASMSSPGWAREIMEKRGNPPQLPLVLEVFTLDQAVEEVWLWKLRLGSLTPAQLVCKVESDAPVFHWDPDEDDEFDTLAKSGVDRERFGRNVWARVGDSHQDVHELPVEGVTGNASQCPVRSKSPSGDRTREARMSSGQESLVLATTQPAFHTLPTWAHDSPQVRVCPWWL